MQPADQLRRWVDSLLSATAASWATERSPMNPRRCGPGASRRRADSSKTGNSLLPLDSYQAILDANPNHVEAKGAARQIVFLMRATAQRLTRRR